jgi:hypothetical protein
VPGTIPIASIVADSAAATGLKWAAPAGGGKVLQVVQAETSTQKVVSTTTFVDSNLSATITPTSATSKVLVLTTQFFSKENNVGGGWRLLRGATTIKTFATEDELHYTGSALTLRAISHGANYLDSPATTSATTYKTQINSSGANFIAQHGGSVVSTMTLLEIGA